MANNLTLFIFADNFSDKAPESPKTTYISTDRWAEEGKQVRLFCEALVGTLLSLF